MVDNDPTWSPDGQLITFSRRTAGTTEPTIASVLAATGDLLVQINDPGLGTAPNYSADARWLAREGPLGVNGYRGILVMPAFVLDYTRIVVGLGEAGARSPK
jgi:hypothetical protein